ncbi:hypothetical protein RFI_05784, partial [Reticulomyxa filosa]
MGNLPSPVRSKFFERAGNEYLKVSVCSSQGFRAHMEDSHIVSMSLSNHPNYHLFGIFDGHNGFFIFLIFPKKKKEFFRCKQAANYLSKHIATKINELENLTNSEYIQKCIMEMDKEFCKGEYSDHGSTLVFALIKTPGGPVAVSQKRNNCKDNAKTKVKREEQVEEEEEEEEKKKDNNNNNNNNKKEDIAISIDTDANANINTNTNNDTDYEVTVYWAGDSRCVWIRENNFKELTEDHVPTLPKEKERIEKANGVVNLMTGRIDHRLAVSRAFGNGPLKDNANIPFDQQKVISLCDFCPTFKASPDDWIFLFCDGLVEACSNEMLVQNLKELVDRVDDPVYALSFLFDNIWDGGSKDNMSACLIQFTGF